MDFLADHAGDMFRPGKATVFFRNLTAIMVCVYFLKRTGFICLRKSFWKAIADMIPICWSNWGGAQAALLGVLLIIRILLKTAENGVLYHFSGDLNNPDSGFYCITAIIWVALGVDEAISYLLWFICMLSMLSYGHTDTTDILTGAIAFFTFLDIITGNYLAYKQIIEKTHLPKKEK